MQSVIGFGVAGDADGADQSRDQKQKKFAQELQDQIK